MIITQLKMVTTQHIYTSTETEELEFQSTLEVDFKGYFKNEEMVTYK